MIAVRAVCLLALGVVGAALGSAQQPAPSARAAGFDRVLWATAEQVRDEAWLRRAQAAGFQSVNLPAGADRAPIERAGLGYYLDQPAGKGFLELRDADWAAVRDRYEQKRDPALLLRPTCLGDEALLAQVAARSAAAAAAANGPGLRFVALADEASATRHNQALDVCRCERCLRAFAAFARSRYDTVPRLNLAWGTEFADWPEVRPLTTDQVRRRELGGTGLPTNLRPFRDWLEFVDGQFASAVHQLAQRVQREVPGVSVGLTGLQAPMAFGGHDYARLLPGLSLVEPYEFGGAVELARSLAPRVDAYCTITLPDDSVRAESLLTAQLAATAALGLRGAVVWNGSAVFEAGGPTVAGRALLAAFARLRAPLDACAGAELWSPGDVWLVESQASIAAWWMLDSVADGMTWVRRLPSHEARNSTSFAARKGWWKLCADLGVTPRFVPETTLPERLLQERPRVLVLPATVALGDRACQAIASYVRSGGVLLADHSPALYDDRLHLRERGGLDDLFGVKARSPRLVDLRVREGRLMAGAGGPVAELGLRGALGEARSDDPVQGQVGASGLEVRSSLDGAQQVFLEQRTGRGRAFYLNLPVCTYAARRLDATAFGAAQDLRRRLRHVLAAASALPPFDVRGQALPTCLHRSLLQTRDGRRILALRIDALDQPTVLFELAKQPVRKVQIAFPRPVHLRMLDGTDLGTKDQFELELDVFAGCFVEQVMS